MLCIRGCEGLCKKKSLKQNGRFYHLTFKIKMFNQHKNQNSTSASCSGLSNLFDPDNQKNWWTAVWKSLVMDQEAEHYRKMKTAVWLFLYLLLHADKRAGLLTRKIKTISSDMGIKRDTIIRWLNTLRKHQYITTRSSGRGLFIQIREWKTLTSDVADTTPQNQQIPDFCSAGNAIAEVAFNRQNEPNSNKKPEFPLSPIDTINKYILNNDIDGKNSLDFPLKDSNQSKLMEVAMDIAAALEDQENLALYISYCQRYPLSLLRTVLGEVKEIPPEKIKKSRGALFNYLVQKYAKKDS